MKVRPHRGSLDDAMAEVREIEPTLEALLAVINEDLQTDAWTRFEPADVEVKPYVKDERIGWDTHLVMLIGYGPWGFTDGPVGK